MDGNSWYLLPDHILCHAGAYILFILSQAEWIPHQLVSSWSLYYHLLECNMIREKILILSRVYLALAYASPIGRSLIRTLSAQIRNGIVTFNTCWWDPITACVYMETKRGEVKWYPLQCLYKGSRTSKWISALSWFRWRENLPRRSSNGTSLWSCLEVRNAALNRSSSSEWKDGRSDCPIRWHLSDREAGYPFWP